MVACEQRQDQRIPVSFEAQYRNKEGQGTPYRRAELTDIHQHGCRLLGGANLKQGKVVSIMVELPSDGSFELEGVTAWCSPVYENRVFETGIRFLGEGPAAEDTRLKFFNSCLENKIRE